MQFRHSYRTATDGTPLLGKAEAALYLLLLFVFNYIHPRYQDYIDTLGAWEDWQCVISRTAYQNSWRAYYAKPARDWVKPFRPLIDFAAGLRRSSFDPVDQMIPETAAAAASAEPCAAAGCLRPP